jgi:hypothetical protein
LAKGVVTVEDRRLQRREAVLRLGRIQIAPPRSAGQRVERPLRGREDQGGQRTLWPVVNDASAPPVRSWNEYSSVRALTCAPAVSRGLDDVGMVLDGSQHQGGLSSESSPPR